MLTIQARFACRLARFGKRGNPDDSCYYRQSFVSPRLSHTLAVTISHPLGQRFLTKLRLTRLQPSLQTLLPHQKIHCCTMPRRVRNDCRHPLLLLWNWKGTSTLPPSVSFPPLFSAHHTHACTCGPHITWRSIFRMHSIYLLNAYYIHIYMYAPLSSLFEDMQHFSTLVLLFSLCMRCICGV